MIDFKKFVLKNGLRVIVHEDSNTAMACVNILYNVGSRDEDPEKTGFAHLFEHLMFSGSVNVPNYDEALQRVGGENNAFTSNDITNYYITLPAANIETALWLESDRMLALNLSKESLEVQRNVVIEEFKQRYLNQPYGDVWIRLRPMAYQVHPYRWATIGKEISHIEHANLTDVKDFFENYYQPSNAVLVIAGNVKFDQIKSSVTKWFGEIPSRPPVQKKFPKEPPQTVARREEVVSPLPVDNIYIAFHAPHRLDEQFYTAEILADILSRGGSSRLFRRLVKDKPLFSDISAYLTGSIDDNLFVVEGKPQENVSVEEAESAIWRELKLVVEETVSEAELIKIKNKVESSLIFAELSILDKAMNLAYFENLGDASIYNSEIEKYLQVDSEMVRHFAAQVFRKENSSTLVYLKSLDLPNAG